MEWLTFISTQVHSVEDNGKHWKKDRDEDIALVRYYFYNNFRKFLTLDFIIITQWKITR